MKTCKNRPVFILVRQFDHPVPFEYIAFLRAPWKKSTFRNRVSDLITLENLTKRHNAFHVFRNSLSAVKIEIWLTCTEELEDKDHDNLISETQSIASYAWPNKAPYDEQGLQELENLLLSLLHEPVLPRYPL